MKRLHRSAGILALAGFWAMSGCGEGRPPVDADSGPATAETSSAVLPEGAQALSLLGEPLYPPEMSESVSARRKQQLAEALEELEKDHEGAEALIWAGRRYAYLGEYRKAIDLFTEGISHHPDDARFYRHRGHRYISVREFDLAIADFQEAARLIEGTQDEVEPDGQPNAMGIPTSTLHFNIWYHYGLAHFIKGDFEAAAEIYERCMDASVHPDSKVATAHWWYMALRRAGRDQDALALIQGLDLDAWAPEVIESEAYMELLRLYARTGVEAGESGLSVDASTMEGAALGYGVGNFYLYNGHTGQARGIFEGIVAARDQWAAFGYIAAEADLARLEDR